MLEISVLPRRFGCAETGIVFPTSTDFRFILALPSWVHFPMFAPPCCCEARRHIGRFCVVERRQYSGHYSSHTVPQKHGTRGFVSITGWLHSIVVNLRLGP